MQRYNIDNYVHTRVPKRDEILRLVSSRLEKFPSRLVSSRTFWTSSRDRLERKIQNFLMKIAQYNVKIADIEYSIEVFTPITYELNQ